MSTRPNISQRRSTSSVQLMKKDADEGDVEPSTSVPKRPTKQFVVHSRHHRVPSARNLKKPTGTRSHGDLVALAQAAAVTQVQAPAAVNQGGKAHSTSPVPPWERLKEKQVRQHEGGGHELKKRSRSNPKRSNSTPNPASKKAQFELVSAPGSFEDTADILANEDLQSAMNEDAAKHAYMGQSQYSKAASPQSDVPDVSSKAQIEEANTSSSAANNAHQRSNGDASAHSTKEGKRPELAGVDHRKTASTGHIRFAPAPSKPATTTSIAKMTNGNRTDSVNETDSSETSQMNTPLTPHTVLTPKSEAGPSHKHPRPMSPPFHGTNHPTAIPPQISATTATAYSDQRRSMSSSSSGPAPQPVTSRFITSSPNGNLSLPSSVRNTPMKQRQTSISFDSPPTPHATPPSDAPITTLSDNTIFRKPGSTNIGAGKPLPNRTQTKILLQRQISQAELEQETNPSLQNQFVSAHQRRGSLGLEGGSQVKLPRETMKEMDRINREYANVRRFVSPVGDSVVRLKGYIKSNRIPQQRRSFERDGSGPQSLGLSQSLGANVADGRREGGVRNAAVSVSGGGSKDDFGLAGRSGSGMDEAKIRELLVHIWSRDEPGGNNLSSSN